MCKWLHCNLLMILPASASNWLHSLNLLMFQINVSELSLTNQILPSSFSRDSSFILKTKFILLIAFSLAYVPNLISQLSPFWSSSSRVTDAPFAPNLRWSLRIWYFHTLACDSLHWDSSWQNTAQIFTQIASSFLCCLLVPSSSRKMEGLLLLYSQTVSTPLYYNIEFIL